MSGYVYAIGCGDRVKIGYSTDPWSRFSKLGTDSAWRATLIGAVPATPQQEREIHRLLSPWRVAGEWFNRGPMAVEAFVLSVRPLARAIRHPKALIGALRAANTSAAKLAAAFGVNRSTITRWSQGTVPADRVFDVERMTGISRHDLRPDIWPRDALFPQQTIEGNAA